MCLAIPGKVVEIRREQEMLMGKVDYNGIFKSACLEHLPEVQIGDYVLVHEAEAKKVFEYLQSNDELEEEK
jgi:hydrogenase expression/formation protein HypC